MDMNANMNNQNEKICSLIETINQLAGDQSINDFSRITTIVGKANNELLGEIFVSACCKGIIRDIEYMLPIMVCNELRDLISQGLCMTVKYQHSTVAKYLIENGADVNYQRQAALKMAVISGQNDIVKCLLKRGANVNVDDGKLLLAACQSGDYDDIVQTLINFGINVENHYHVSYDTCISLNRMKIASVLVKYSNEHMTTIEPEPPTKDIDTPEESYENYDDDKSDSSRSDSESSSESDDDKDSPMNRID